MHRAAGSDRVPPRPFRLPAESAHRGRVRVHDPPASGGPGRENDGRAPLAREIGLPLDPPVIQHCPRDPTAHVHLTRCDRSLTARAERREARAIERGQSVHDHRRIRRKGAVSTGPTGQRRCEQRADTSLGILAHASDRRRRADRRLRRRAAAESRGDHHCGDPVAGAAQVVAVSASGAVRGGRRGSVGCGGGGGTFRCRRALQSARAPAHGSRRVGRRRRSWRSTAATASVRREKRAVRATARPPAVLRRRRDRRRCRCAAPDRD